jgi:hypothetical protein
MGQDTRRDMFDIVKDAIGETRDDHAIHNVSAMELRV